MDELSRYLVDSLDGIRGVGRELSQTVRPDADFPDWPFVATRAATTVWDFDWIITYLFGPVLEVLATEFGDEEIFVYVSDPLPTTQWDLDAGLNCCFRFPAAMLPHLYGNLMWLMPDPSVNVQVLANEIAISGSSRQWGVWASRDYEIGVVAAARRMNYSSIPEIEPLRDGEDIQRFESPPGFISPISPEDKTRFWAELQAHALPEESPGRSRLNPGEG